jgi:hypothetical protein
MTGGKFWMGDHWISLKEAQKDDALPLAEGLHDW